MGFDLYRPVWDAPLPSTPKLVLLGLANFAADGGGSIFPSVARVAKLCGLKERAVQSAIALLRKLGVLVLVKEADFATKQPREYRIDIDQLRAIKFGDYPCIKDTGVLNAPVHQTREPVHNMRRTGVLNAPKLTNELTIELTRGAVALFPVNLTTYQPSPKTIEWAKVHAPGIDIPRELELWRTRNANPRAGRTKPPVIRDFDASFRNALLKALEFAKQDGRIKVATQSPDDFLRRNGVEI